MLGRAGVEFRAEPAGYIGGVDSGSLLMSGAGPR